MGKEHFIAKAKTVHGDRYDYSRVEYVTIKTKVTIICPEHGEFQQTPSNHYQFGCYQCGRDAVVRKETKTNELFKAEATKLHKGKYDYSKTEYRRAHAKVEILCPTHGSFWQTPRSHLNKRGCPECKQGKGHPKYGRPGFASQGYFGTYHGNTFRSLPELFWMVEMETKGISFIALDQHPNRQTWQVETHGLSKYRTYCADFYRPDTNEVIDIKPRWKETVEREKLEMGRREYEKRGYLFSLVYTDTIKISIKRFRQLVDTGVVALHPTWAKRCQLPTTLKGRGLGWF